MTERDYKMSRLTKKMIKKNVDGYVLNHRENFTENTYEVIQKLGKLEDLEEQLGCPLETVIEHLNESYKMLCNHIEINKEYIKLGKCRDLEELVKRSDDIAISKEQKGLCEKYFTWLKEDKSE